MVRISAPHPMSLPTRTRSDTRNSLSNQLGHPIGWSLAFPRPIFLHRKANERARKGCFSTAGPIRRSADDHSGDGFVRDHGASGERSKGLLGPVQKQVNHFRVMPREIGCFRFRSLDSCRSRPRPTSVESGASSSHHVMGCAPIEATWLLDRPLSRAMTLLL